MLLPCQNRYGNALDAARPWSTEAISAPNASRHWWTIGKFLAVAGDHQIPHGTGVSVGANVPSSLRLLPGTKEERLISYASTATAEPRFSQRTARTPTDHPAAANPAIGLIPRIRPL